MIPIKDNIRGGRLPFVFFVTVIELRALYMRGAFVLQALSGAANQTRPTGSGGGVAYFARSGGFMCGLPTIKLLARRRNQLPPAVPA